MTEQDEPARGRDAELLWGARQRPTRGPKPSLRLEDIVRVAIDIADAEGLDALSMQRIAAELGAGTMSLYRYVPGKNELVSLMLDTAIGAPPTVDTTSGWRAALDHWAHATLAVFQRHPWALATATTRRTLGPNETAFAETALRALAGTGLDPTTMMDTLMLLNGFVRGTAQLTVPAPEQGEGQPHLSADLIRESGSAHRFPTLMTVFEAAATEPERPQRGFEYGLQRILDGIEAHVNASG